MKTKKSKKTTAPAAAAATADELVIEQGYGLTAAIDEQYLIITQHDGETGQDDKVCVSRSELRQIIGKFGSWAA